MGLASPKIAADAIRGFYLEFVALISLEVDLYKQPENVLPPSCASLRGLKKVGLQRQID